METKDTLSSCSNSEEQQMQQIQDKAKESCMVSFRRLYSHLKLISNNDLKETRTESGFKRAFVTLFGQDVETFTGTMFLNMDQLEKQLDNEEFQEIRSMDSFKIPEFRDTLIQHMESVKKLINERAHHKRESETKSKEQDTSSRLGNGAHADDADIRPIYDEEPMAEPWFASQVDVNNDLSKPVTTHYLPKERESAVVKPHQVIASSESRNSSKNTLRFSSNDMVHNHYLEEAKKKTQERSRNSRPSVMSYAKSQSTTNGSKPKPRINTQTSRNWPTSKNSKIFKAVGLRWVPTRKIFTSSTTKVDSEPTNGLNEDITNQYKCEQTLDVSAGTLNLSAVMTSDHNSSELEIYDHNIEPSSSKLILNVVPSADTTALSKQELDLLFGPLYDEFFTVGTSCVNKSSYPIDNSTQQDTPPLATAQSTTELITPTTTITAEDNM
ncbi:hypothetical protein Tco_0557020 [Tanacetum coccineum]